MLFTGKNVKMVSSFTWILWLIVEKINFLYKLCKNVRNVIK